MSAVKEGDWTVEQGIRSVSDDQIVSLTVAVTTKAIAADGSRVEVATVDRIPDPPPPPLADKDVLAVALELGPSGATFDPPLLFTVDYGKLNLPANADVSKIGMYLWTGTAWERVDAKVDPATQTVSALLYHFSAYAVIAPIDEPTPFHWLLYGGAGALLLGSFFFLLGYMRRWSIAIALPMGTITTGPTSQPIRLEAKDAKRRPFRPGTDVAVRLSTTSPTGKFDVRPDGPFDGSVTQAIIPHETGVATVYYTDLTPGTQTLRARSEFGLRKWIRSRPPAWTKSQVDVLPPDSPPQP